jgi:pSer/pThr/pTyr-binding forkhead associated (FHA) protein
MIQCPNCHHQEISGALFCSECGTQLVIGDRQTTHEINRTPSDTLMTQSIPPQIIAPPVSVIDVEAVVSLNLIESGQIVNLGGRNEFTLGRVTEGQPILPDVDLTPFEAYAQGVSRLHAVLKILNKQVLISDFGSSNGTRVNGQKIMPHVDYPLNHGDVVALGKLKVQIIIRK